MAKVQYLLQCYSGENFFELSEDLERSGESEEYADWNLYQASDDFSPEIENQEINARNGVLNYRMQQNIRNIARVLRDRADSLCVKPGSALLSVERTMLNEGLNQEEMQVVKSMLSERTPTTVSKIAEHLGKYMTSRTFHAALRYLSYSATSPVEELALSCELVKVIYPKIKQLARSDSVHDTINKFIDDRLDEVLD